jgi:hypothetical protein
MCVHDSGGPASAGRIIKIPRILCKQKPAEIRALITFFSPLAWILLFAVFAVAARLIWG